MATTWVSLVALVLSNLVVVSDAGAFLQARAEDKYISKSVVESTLLRELSGVTTSAKIHSMEGELRSMFVALPKNSRGGLEPTVVRYALHRFFVHRHGWYMLGLDPAGGSWNSSTPSNIVKDRAPAYIQSLFEQRLHGRGLGLHELAVFAAVLTDLVHKEATTELHRVYTMLRLPTIGPVPQIWSQQAVKAYLIHYLIGGNITTTTIADFKILERELIDMYPDWVGTYMWVEDFRQTFNLMQVSKRNPFVEHRPTFDDSVGLIKELGHNFGSFQDLECKALKGRLVEMEYHGTGRIRLSRFYSGGVNGDWTLSESVEYLRNLGALDETDPNMPSVVIPNYITSQTNCLTASGFYSVCCSDECDGLLRHLEAEIAAPTAEPARVAQVVSALHSDTVDAPRNLSTALLTRLDEIGQFHGGLVPLHGRLFAQWMHHTYPRECPFPHVSGTTSPMSPDDWMAYWGIDNVEATLEEMQWHHSKLQDEGSESEEDLALPWHHVEELVNGHQELGVSRTPWVSTPLRFVMALAALASFALPLVRASKAAISSSSADKIDRMLV